MSTIKSLSGRPAVLAVVAVATVALFAPVVGAQTTLEKKLPAADGDMEAYKATPASGPVEALRDALSRGRARLEFSEVHGYLTALLRELQLPATSQLLVASKTSPNKTHISPRNPRALYFNDSVAVAFVPGADLIEVAAADPKLGVVFYTLEQKPGPQPRLTRDDRCLECHVSAKTLHIPGWMVRSFVTHEDGDVDVLSGLMVTHRTPIAQRWGGYYVTGNTGGQLHRGNTFASGAAQGREAPAPNPVTLTDLRPFVDVARFPEPGSDVVALLVLEHQVHMMNLLTALRRETETLNDNEMLSKIDPTTEAVLKYLLFVEEAPLGGPVRGSSDFAVRFTAQGPADSQGHSLRQFDLQTRLFKYPCSFMVYSPSFDALPPRAKRHIYRRLWEILSGEDPSGVFKSIRLETRTAIREILLQTKKDLPSYWRL